MSRHGRPRVHPEGTTARERVNASLARLRKAGGMRKTFRLTPDAMTDLDILKSRNPRSTETEIVITLLADAARD